MPVNSLAVFVLVGIASGLAFGLYLIDVRNTSQLVYVEGSSLSIVTEKLDFEKGEPVKIRIVNSGTVPLLFSDTFGLKITGLSGILMYAPESTSETFYLEPRQEEELIWDQIKDDGNMALEGLYKIHATGEDPQGASIEKSTTVTIWK